MFLVKIFSLLAYFVLVFLIARIVEFYMAGTLDIFGHFEKYLCVFIDILPFTEKYSKDSDLFTSNSNYKDGIKEVFDQETSAEKLNEIEFLTYEQFIENVKDTKASIWVVKINSIEQSKNVLNNKQWLWLSHKLHHYGIKTAIYHCCHAPRLCMKLSIYTSSIILLMPKGSKPKSNVAFHIYDEAEKGFTTDIKESVFQWIQSRLYPKVKTVHSFYELSHHSTTNTRKDIEINYPSLSFIYQSTNQAPPPLLLTSLSVRFTGRVKFYMLKTDKKLSMGDAFAMNEYLTYNYGEHKGESFNYPCMELFFRSLHPELNDIFIVSVILLNMACWLELFLQKGGPLRRILFYLWGLGMANILLVTVWLPLIQLMYIPQFQPFLNMFLKRFQQIMLSNFAAVIRQDILQVSQHIYMVLVGFFCYGILLGYLHYRLRYSDGETSFSLTDIFDNDVREVSDIFRSIFMIITPTLHIYRFEERIERVLNRLATPDLWLHSFQSNDYVTNLPVWTHCGKFKESAEYSSSSCLSSESDVSYSEVEDSIVASKRCFRCHQKLVDANCNEPNYILKCNECVICLEKFKCNEVLLGLPCGHSFHKCCVEDWLLSGTACNKRRCPICRWPADLPKGKYEVIDTVE